MVKNEYSVIGVMSGTSLDGIDLAYIHFIYNKVWSFKIDYFNTIPYTSSWLKTLQNLVLYSKEELINIDIEYTAYLAILINGFIKKNEISSIDAICSHGHTALHQPEKGMTYQIGNLKSLATLTNSKVVCDFRIQDVKLGGQGAPLVPIGDKLLFFDYDFCLNLGGFANISFEKNKQRIAYDICPVNIVLNHFSRKVGLDFDDKGKIASSGKVNLKLLKELNELPFFKLKHPKSLGLEWVKKVVIPIIDKFGLEIKDVIRTYIEHIAIQISRSINFKVNASVLITGGGVFNIFLISRIKALTTNRVIIPSKDIVNYKEAIIFGFLGVLKICNADNCLSSVTGAKHDHSSGEIYLP